VVFATQHGNVVAAEIERKVVADIRYLADMSRQLPSSQEKSVVFEVEEFVVAIGPW
jgi:hypothetical protein